MATSLIQYSNTIPIDSAAGQGMIMHNGDTNRCHEKYITGKKGREPVRVEEGAFHALDADLKTTLIAASRSYAEKDTRSVHCPARSQILNITRLYPLVFPKFYFLVQIIEMIQN